MKPKPTEDALVLAGITLALQDLMERRHEGPVKIGIETAVILLKQATVVESLHLDPPPEKPDPPNPRRLALVKPPPDTRPA